MFKPLAGRNKLSKLDLDKNGNVTVYSSETTNNGIMGYTCKEADYKVSIETPVYLIFGDHTRSMNIATSDFCVMDNVKVLIPYNQNIKTILFICAVWIKTIPNLGYARHWSKAEKSILKLPTLDGVEPDYKSMEYFITKLESEQSFTLKSYLLETGLIDFVLTSTERKALQNFETLQWEEFKVINIFDVKNTGNILSRDIIEDSGETPYLCASAENNSVNSYVSYDEKYLDKGNCIFIGGKTFVVSYQENDFYSNDSHNLVLYLRNEQNRNKLNQLFLAVCIYKSMSHKYSWGDSVSNKKIQKDIILLPVKNGEPAFEFMRTFISAIQKLIIKDVVLYVENKIELRA